MNTMVEAQIQTACNDFFETWKALVKVQRLVSPALESDLQTKHGIGLSEYEAMEELRNADNGRMRMNELASSVMLTPSGLTRLVDRLEADGIVVRESCPTDGRGSHVRITERGISLLARAEKTYRKDIKDYFGEEFTGAAAVTKACNHIVETILLLSDKTTETD